MDKGAKDNITPISHEAEGPQRYELTRTELIAVRGINAQRKALEDYVVAKQSEINEQTRDLIIVACERTGVSVEAIGKTHFLSTEQGAIVPIPPPEKPPEQPVEQLSPPSPNTAQAG